MFEGRKSFGGADVDEGCGVVGLVSAEDVVKYLGTPFHIRLHGCCLDAEEGVCDGCHVGWEDSCD